MPQCWDPSSGCAGINYAGMGSAEVQSIKWLVYSFGKASQGVTTVSLNQDRGRRSSFRSLNMKLTLLQDDGMELELLKGNTYGEITAALGAKLQLLDADHLQLTPQSVYSKAPKVLTTPAVSEYYQKFDAAREKLFTL